MTSVENTRARLLKGYEAGAHQQKAAFLTCRPLLREIITHLTQEIAKDDDITADEARHQTRALSNLWDVINTLEIAEPAAVARSARPALSKPRE